MRLMLFFLFILPALSFGASTFDSVLVEENLTISSQDADSACVFDSSKNLVSVSALPIINGGTGQTTATAALNALLPSQTGNSGKVLSTNGTNASWQTVSGSGTVTNVISSDGSIDITNGTTIPNLSVHFPMRAPTGTTASGYCFDSDTCTYSTSDGTWLVSTNNVNALTINNNQQAVFSTSVQATDFIYPTKTANTFLAGPTTGSPATPSFRTIQQGDISVSAIPFPLYAPGGGANSGYCFDSDTCLNSSSDGVMHLSTNNVNRVTLDNNGNVSINGGNFSVTGNVNITGNVTAANLPPTGTANTLARFDSSGILSGSQWAIDPDTFALSNITSLSSPLTDFTQISNQTNLPAISGTARSLYFSLQGSDPIGAVNGWQLDVGVPSVTGNMNLMAVQSSSGTSVGGDGSGLGVNIDSQFGGGLTELAVNAGNTVTVANDFNGAFFNLGPASVGGNANVIGVSYFGTSVAGDLSLFNAGTQNSLSISGNYRGIQGHNNASVGQFGQLVTVSQAGVVTKGLDVFSANVSADVGDGSGVNLNGFNMTTGSITVDGSINFAAFSNQADSTGQISLINAVNSGSHAGFNGILLNNSGNMTGNNNYNVILSSNSGTGYSFGGIVVGNNANMTEEIRGFQANLIGNSRTGTGLQINMGGNTYADDARAIQYNVSGATVTNGRMVGIEGQGGVLSIQSSFTPFNNAFVDIGNNISVTGTVASALTGTDLFMSFFQSNLLVQDDISLGPLGIGVTMNGFLSQIDVASGKTVPLVRASLIGTSVPSGSGGTISKYAAAQVIGLPSFGGSVTNNERIGILEETILGQNFCDGASDCWLLRLEDSNSENYLNKLAVGTSNKKTASNVRLEFHDGHIRSTQTTDPSAAPQSGAGTGATCSVSDATDTAGQISIITGTSGLSTGSYCQITFDSSYNTAPICTLTPAGSTLSTDVYVTSTTTTMDVNFAVAGGISSTYLLNYHCVETQ